MVQKEICGWDAGEMPAGSDGWPANGTCDWDGERAWAPYSEKRAALGLLGLEYDPTVLGVGIVVEGRRMFCAYERLLANEVAAEAMVRPTNCDIIVAVDKANGE